MGSDFFTSHVYKMGPKLGLYLNKNFMKEIKINIGEPIKIFIKSEGIEDSFLSKMNSLISLKRKIISRLKLVPDKAIDMRIEKFIFSKRPLHLFNDGRIDLLYLIPEKNRLGFEIFVEEFNKKDSIWLKAWYCHNRGSCRAIELKRFLKIEKFGKFLGLMQSEGTKSNIKVMEFCNKSIQEHLDFLEYLDEIGISKELIFAKLDYHPRIKDVQNIINFFEKKTGIPIKYSVMSPTSGGGYGFKMIVRSQLLTEIVNNSLNKIMNLVKEQIFEKDINKLRNAFLSKILSGDGNLEIITKNRKTPQARLKICDGSEKYREDYKSLMEVYGLKPHIYAKENFVRSYINYDFVKELIKMGAFENNPNYNKLLKYIELIEGSPTLKIPSGL